MSDVCASALPSYEQTTECDVRALVACGFDADDARHALADADRTAAMEATEALKQHLATLKSGRDLGMLAEHY
jgi:Holliday junction resolvasome RuvABC DNA-binding subunit